ncbi:MAG: phosphoglycolate phosphatase [Betaproteobacteria bacterium]|nr:phosphoglycolate phosphatase [Betaproteobacteria bacterium]
MNRFDVDAVAFDFDGTLVDTVGDLAHAMNATLAEDGCAPLVQETIRDLVGRGIPHLARRAYALSRGDAPGDAELEAIVARYFAHYAATLGERSTPYPGVVEGLGRLRAAGFPLAVVTNKASRFVRPHLDRTAFADWFDAIVGGDDAGAKKPDAAPLALAAARLGVDVRRVLMVGDSGNDVACARAAGAPVVVVPYGYREGRAVQDLAADAIVDSLDELPERVAVRRTPDSR